MSGGREPTSKGRGGKGMGKDGEGRGKGRREREIFAGPMSNCFRRPCCRYTVEIISVHHRVARSPVFSGSSRISAPISRLPDRSQNFPYLTRRIV